MSLVDTRQQGERKREEWLADFAKRSAVAGWAEDIARAKARMEITEAEMVGNLKSKKAIDNGINEGVLAAHPDVRDHFSRLVKIRDELWEMEPDYLRRTLHGPSQILIELMRRQKKPNERHHTNNAADFLTYLRKDRLPS